MATLLLDGSLYGTTWGASVQSTVFQLNGEGESTLCSLAPPGVAVFPYGRLVRDTAGSLYGTSAGGGTGLGSIFQVTAAGVETVLHSFTSAEGTDPYGGLVLDTAGTLYGATGKGGAYGFGSIFKLGRAGDFSILHQFSGPPDGAAPVAAFLSDKGELFGSTGGGGANNAGTVLQVNAGTGTTAVLYSFTNGTDGGIPFAGLISDGEGNLYGTAVAGGSAPGANGNGVVFKLNVATRQQVVLWTFSGADGSQPYGGLIRDAQGDLFGTTQYGGIFNLGTVFRLAASGKLTTLHNFTGGNDGSYPVAGLAINSKGELFGAASEGGSAGYGTIFSITFP